MDLKEGIEILVSNSLRKLARKKEPKIITHRYLNNYLMYECDEVSVFYVKKNDIGFRSICNYFIRTEPYGNESPNIEKIKWINEIVVVKYVEEYLCFFDDFIVNEPIKPRNGLLWNIEIYDIWSNPDPHTVKYGKIKGIGILLRQLGFYDFFVTQNKFIKFGFTGGFFKKYRHGDVFSNSYKKNEIFVENKSILYDYNTSPKIISGVSSNDPGLLIIDFDGSESEDVFLSLKFCDRLVITKNTSSVFGPSRNTIVNSKYTEYLKRQEWILIDGHGEDELDNFVYDELIKVGVMKEQIHFLVKTRNSVDMMSLFETKSKLLDVHRDAWKTSMMSMYHKLLNNENQNDS